MKMPWFLPILSLIILSLSPVAAGASVFKIATIAPEGAFEVVQMQAAAAEIKDKTQSRVSFKFFTGGVMGSDQGVLRKIRIRQLQGGAVSSGSLSAIYPDSQIYSLPLVFRSMGEVDYVRKTLDPVLTKGYEDAGFVIFGIAEGGFAQIMSTNPVASIHDLQNQKAWVPENDKSAFEAVKAFGVSPIPLSIADVRTGLQTGMINTVAIPPAYAILLHWHTQVKYITQLPLIYTFGVLAIDKGAFMELSGPDQAVVREILGSAFARMDKHNRNQNDEAMALLKTDGIQEVVPDAPTVAQWREKAQNAIAIMAGHNILSKNIVDTLDRLLSEFRNKKP
ncbi:MAG: TRAP transporter substrate-binding protein DctP [Pseudomonadota bacterium]